MENTRVLVTGASGFVGGALTEALVAANVPTRAFVRDAASYDAPNGAEVAEGDLDEPAALGAALQDVDVVYYLVHSMSSDVQDDFAERDRALAEATVEAADRAGVRRIVYLGGVHPSGEGSEHLDSRRDVEDRLAAFTGGFVALRASMIVGAGSASFRALAQIVERLPVLALPTWRDRRTQPVAIDDVVGALVAARTVAPGRYDIAGADTLTYEEMTEVIAELLGETPRSFPLPFSSSRLEGAAAAVVADGDPALLTPLMEGLHADIVVHENALPTVFGVDPTPFRDAAQRALAGLSDA